MQAAITNKPINLSHRKNRRSHLPSHSRTKPYLEDRNACIDRSH